MEKDDYKLDLDNLTPEDAREELKGFYVERMTSSRWIKIEAYHEIGKAIVQKKVDIDTVIETTGRNKSDVEIWIAFATEFKTTGESPFTKDSSWRDVKERYVKPKERISFRISNLKKILDDREMINTQLGLSSKAEEDRTIIDIVKNKGR